MNDKLGTVPFDTDEAAREAVERREVLLSLANGPATTSEVEEMAGFSSSTAYRVMSSFEEKGFVEKNGSGAYEITPVGEGVAHELERFHDGVGTVAKMSRVLESLEGTAAEPEPGAFVDGEVVVSNREHPYEPARRFIDAFGDSGELRLLAVSSATPMFTPEVHRMIAEGRETEIVCPEEIVETNLDRMSDEMVEKLPEYLSVYVHEDPPATVALFDSRVGFGGHDEEKGTLDVFADTDDDGAYAEGEELYEKYRAEATKYL